MPANGRGALKTSEIRTTKARVILPAHTCGHSQRDTGPMSDACEAIFRNSFIHAHLKLQLARFSSASALSFSSSILFSPKSPTRHHCLLNELCFDPLFFYLTTCQPAFLLRT